MSASIADEFREALGNGVRLTFAAENGVKVGKPDAELGISLALVQGSWNAVAKDAKGKPC